VAYISIVNAYLSCGDILGAGEVLLQIPANAVVRNRGRKAYLKAKPTRAEGVAPNGGPVVQKGDEL